MGGQLEVMVVQLVRNRLRIISGIKLALKSLNAALRRDSASGSGYDVVTITSSGIKRVIEKDLTQDLTK